MKQKSANPVTSSFDVSFCPMDNVKASVTDPFNLTPEEERSIIGSDARLISGQTKSQSITIKR